MKLAIVELHDVSPFHREEVYTALEFLEKVGIEKCSLLLIPNYLGEYPINRYASFVSFIEKTKQEIILHGYTHIGKPKIQHLLYTYREGEFAKMGLEETYKSLEKALDLMEAMRLETQVFVPPAWIGNEWLEDLLCSFGFLVVGYRRKIKNLASGNEIDAPAITFSNRYGLSYISIRALPLLYRLLKKSPVIRLALHSADFKDRRKIGLWRLILSQIKKERRLVSYGELLGKSRPASSLKGLEPSGGLVQ